MHKLAYGALVRRSTVTLAFYAICRSYAADVGLLNFAPHLLFSGSVAFLLLDDFTSFGLPSIVRCRVLGLLVYPSEVAILGF